MEVNGQNFENISITKAVDILRNNTHLSLTIKTNIFGEHHLTAPLTLPCDSVQTVTLCRLLRPCV